jgi:hypothetical protein
MSAPLALPGVDFAPRAEADSDDQHTPPWLVAEVDAFFGGIGSVVVITPGFAEVRTASGATHLVHDGSWVAKRRASAMARAASLTFGRPRTRGAVKA